ncbi:MAG: rhomboid family intramembrane serine protease [Bacteroidia bacterium]|nr:rhomboid family intramembrane serine protease [Bacteroidia bacterium]
MGTITLMLILIIALTSAFAFSQKETMAQLQFNAYQIWHRHQYYRILTHVLVHANWEHLIVNMIVFYSFGTAVEHYFDMYFGTIGSYYYLILFFGSVIFSTLLSLYKQKDNPYYNAVGASGAVSAVLFTAIFFDPWNPIYFFGILPFPGIIFGGLYLYYSYYMSTKKTDNIGHDAHFMGAIFGFFFPVILRPELLMDFIKVLFGGSGQ